MLRQLVRRGDAAETDGPGDDRRQRRANRRKTPETEFAAQSAPVDDKIGRSMFGSKPLVAASISRAIRALT